MSFYIQISIFIRVLEPYAVKTASTVLREVYLFSFLFILNLNKQKRIFKTYPTKPGHFSRTLAKGPNTTTWIWNLHADAHDFDSHTSDLEEISRKIFSAHFGQLGIILIWLSGCDTKKHKAALKKPYMRLALVTQRGTSETASGLCQGPLGRGPNLGQGLLFVFFFSEKKNKNPGPPGKGSIILRRENKEKLYKLSLFYLRKSLKKKKRNITKKRINYLLITFASYILKLSKKRRAS